MTLTESEAQLIRAIAAVVAQGRPTGLTFTARAMAGWLSPEVPSRLRSERAVGPVLDLLGCEPNPRTSRRRTTDLMLAALPYWTALADAAQAQAQAQQASCRVFEFLPRVSERVLARATIHSLSCK